jgi:hypothetical protein
MPLNNSIICILMKIKSFKKYILQISILLVFGLFLKVFLSGDPTFASHKIELGVLLLFGLISIIYFNRRSDKLK